MNVTTTTLGFQKLAGFFYSGLGATYTTTVSAGTGEIKNFNVLKRPLSGSAAGSVGVGGSSGTVVYTEDADVEFELEVWGQVTRVGTFVITSVPTGGRQGSGLASYEVGAAALEGLFDPKTGGIIPLPSTSKNTVIIGDSIAGQDFPTASGGFLQSLSNGLFQAINYRLYNRLNLVGVLGLTGNRSDQILAAMPAFLNQFPELGYAFISVGQNDVAQYITAPRTSAQYKATLVDIIETLTGRGITPILFDITGSAAIITTAGMADMWVSCNRALKDVARQYPSVIHLPINNLMSDVATSFPANLASLSDGSFHPNALAAKNIGDMAYSILDPLIPPIDLFDAHYHTGGTTELNLTTNPLQQNTSALTGGTTPTGNVASGGLVTVAGTGVGVGSVVANTFAPTGSQWSQVAYTGPASAVNATDYVQALGSSSAISLALAGLAVGDILQAFYEIEFTGTPSNLMGAEMFLNFVGASGSVTPPIGNAGTYSRSYANKQNNSVAPLVALGSVGMARGVLATPQLPIPTGTTAIQLFVRVYPVSGSSSATFTVRFGRNRVLKVFS